MKTIAYVWIHFCIEESGAQNTECGDEKGGWEAEEAARVEDEFALSMYLPEEEEDD